MGKYLQQVCFSFGGNSDHDAHDLMVPPAGLGTRNLRLMRLMLVTVTIRPTKWRRVLGFNLRGFYPVLGFQDRSLRARPTLQSHRLLPVRKISGKCMAWSSCYLQGNGTWSRRWESNPDRLFHRQDNPHPFGPKIMVSPAGLQPATFRLGNGNSMQLSYEDKMVLPAGIQPAMSCLEDTRLMHSATGA